MCRYTTLVPTMSVNRKSKIDDSGEKCVIIADSDSVDPSDNDSDNDIVFPIVFHCFEKYHTVEDY